MKNLLWLYSFMFLVMMGIVSLETGVALSQGIIQEQEKIEKQILIAAKWGRPSHPVMVKVSTLESPILGNTNAPITLVVFTDYLCPNCQWFYNNILPEFKKKYIDTGIVRLVLRDLPLNDQARSAAKGTHCAGAQGMYWQMHNALFENQTKMKEGKLKVVAEKISLNKKEFLWCMKSDRFKERIDRDVNDADKARISEVPTFIMGISTDNAVNGFRLVGAQSLTAFEGHLQKLLKNAENKITDN